MFDWLTGGSASAGVATDDEASAFMAPGGAREQSLPPRSLNEAPGPSREQLLTVLEDIIKMLDEERPQQMMREAGVAQQDMRASIVEMLVRNGVESELAGHATQVAYGENDPELQEKVELILSRASKHWHNGMLKAQQEKNQFQQNKELFEEKHLMMAREMAQVQDEVVEMLNTLDGEGKKKLYIDMETKLMEWQQQLMAVPAQEQNTYLLTMEPGERMRVLKMQIILQMKRTAEQQRSMTDAAMTAHREMKEDEAAGVMDMTDANVKIMETEATPMGAIMRRGD
jgi:hypothetical protein